MVYLSIRMKSGRRYFTGAMPLSEAVVTAQAFCKAGYPAIIRKVTP